MWCPASSPVPALYIACGLCYDTYMKNTTACHRHEVIGCTQEVCRAEALGLTVAGYRHWVTEPVAGTIRRLERRDASIRRATGRG